MFDLWSALAKALRAPALPIDLARQSRMEDLGLLGFAVMTSPTVLRGLETFVRYGALLNDHGRWETNVDATRVEVRFVATSPRTLGFRLSVETNFAQIAGSLRQLCGAWLDPIVVSFRHQAPSDTRAHRAFLRCRLEFGVSCDRIVFPRAPFDTVPHAANGELHRYLRTRADELLERLEPKPLAARAKDEIARSLADGVVPNLLSVAQAIGASEKTLRRALSTEGTTFRRALDEVRREHARTLLEQKSISISRAAIDAGFTDPSAFTHACRRWFGRSPSELRPRSTVATLISSSGSPPPRPAVHGVFCEPASSAVR